MKKSGSFLKYVKAAFMWHWNLLAVGGGLAFAFLSGLPDVVIPLLGAAEILFLGALSTQPRFRKSVDARGVSVVKESKSQDEQLKRILSAISQNDYKRFEALRSRCMALTSLGKQFHGLDSSSPVELEQMHMSSLDRLLWMFLKLLYSKDALDRFLKNTDRNLLIKEIERTEQSLARAREKSKENLVRTLDDKLNTMHDRLRNYDQAEENCELIEAELERVEQKVKAVSEMSLSSGDPTMLSSQVDGIAASISITADAIRTLDVLPDLNYDDQAPEFLTQK